MTLSWVGTKHATIWSKCVSWKKIPISYNSLMYIWVFVTDCFSISIIRNALLTDCNSSFRAFLTVQISTVRASSFYLSEARSFALWCHLSLCFICNQCLILFQRLLYRCWNTYILSKKASIGHGSTSVMSLNTVCRPLNLINLLHVMSSKHLSWKSRFLTRLHLRNENLLFQQGFSN